MKKTQNFAPPVIQNMPEICLVGMNISMTINNDKSHQLWQEFMPRATEIKDRNGREFYVAQEFTEGYFDNYQPDLNFTKWAAVCTSPDAELPDGMDRIVVPAGLYAVFTYQGRPSEAAPFFFWVFTEWIPQSGYSIALRPHLAIMGKEYKGENPDSSESICIPLNPV